LRHIPFFMLTSEYLEEDSTEVSQEQILENYFIGSQLTQFNIFETPRPTKVTTKVNLV
jgi:hypothetical protein